MTTSRTTWSLGFLAITVFQLCFGRNAFVGGSFSSSNHNNDRRRHHWPSKLLVHASQQSTTSSSSSSSSNIRGSRYGESQNSTIPTAQAVAAILGVRPTKEAPASTWKRAWDIQRAALPFLHAFDRGVVYPPNSHLALACLWWKPLSANDPTSPAYDNSLAHDLLPPLVRKIVQRPFCRLYPRLHHANVELRTAYLDQAVRRIILEIHGSQDHLDGPPSVSTTKRVRLVSLGAGYDVRSIKFREQGLVDQAIELDLPEVIHAKTQMLNAPRFQRRRPHCSKDMFPQFYPIDLNQVDDVRSILRQILTTKDHDSTGTTEQQPQDATTWYTIFLFEGVMIYLDKGIPEALLRICSQVLKETNSQGSLCFADRLENIPGGDLDIGRVELAKTGWSITDWLPKPGLARHMGCAELR